jgi:hypothetical protein
MSGKEGFCLWALSVCCPKPCSVVGPDLLNPNSDPDLVLILVADPDLQSSKNVTNFEKIAGKV